MAADLCSAYCTGYADGKEAATKGGLTMKEWNDIFDDCLTWSSFCNTEPDGPENPETGLE